MGCFVQLTPYHGIKTFYSQLCTYRSPSDTDKTGIYTGYGFNCFCQPPGNGSIYGSSRGLCRLISWIRNQSWVVVTGTRFSAMPLKTE